MKTIASAVRFLVFSNLFIGTCVLSFTIKTSIILFGNFGNVHVCALIFAATVFLYCFHKLYRRYRFTEEEHKEQRHRWVDAHIPLYYGITILAFLVALSQMFFMPIRLWVLLSPVSFMALGYSIPFIKKGEGFIRLRDIRWLKALWIALSYGWLSTFLPIAFVLPVNQLCRPDVMLMFIRNLLFVFALVIPFDIRDVKYDARNGTRTLPIIMGVQGAVNLALALLALFAISTLVSWYFFGLNKWMATALWISAFQTACVIPFSKPERPNLFFPLGIESTMLIQCLLVILASHMI
jgi:4-hydroxybenzoate polyprenyltransferase